jgi:hypothetical protein
MKRSRVLLSIVVVTIVCLASVVIHAVFGATSDNHVYFNSQIGLVAGLLYLVGTTFVNWLIPVKSLGQKNKCPCCGNDIATCSLQIGLM